MCVRSQASPGAGVSRTCMSLCLSTIVPSKKAIDSLLGRARCIGQFDEKPITKAPRNVTLHEMEDSMQVEESVQDRAAVGAVETLKGARSSKKTAAAAGASAERLPGTSPFPISKVSKIIKADKDVQMCQREAVFLISCAAVRPSNPCIRS